MYVSSIPLKNIFGEAFSVVFVKMHSSFQSTKMFFIEERVDMSRIALVQESWKFLIILYILYRCMKLSSFKLPSSKSDPLFCVVSSVKMTFKK